MVNLWGVKYYESHFTDDQTEVYNKSEVICPRLVRGGGRGMEECVVWKESMWPLQAGGVSDLFPVVGGREEQTFLSPLLPMC